MKFQSGEISDIPKFTTTNESNHISIEDAAVYLVHNSSSCLLLFKKFLTI